MQCECHKAPSQSIVIQQALLPGDGTVRKLFVLNMSDADDPWNGVSFGKLSTVHGSWYDSFAAEAVETAVQSKTRRTCVKYQGDQNEQKVEQRHFGIFELSTSEQSNANNRSHDLQLTDADGSNRSTFYAESLSNSVEFDKT
jgi:hypothetical protein